MPRQRIPNPDEEQLRVDQIRPVHRGRGRPRNEENDDPRQDLVGVVQEPKKLPRTKALDDGSGLHTQYARALVANQGNIEKALAAVFNISEEEALTRMVELHEKVRSYSRSGISLQEMLERHDLTRETRLAVLREALFSPNVAVRMKAVEMIDEIDMTAKAARIGSTWDDIVRIAKDRAMRKKKAS